MITSYEYKYPYIGYCSTYNSYAVFYRKDWGVLLNPGSSWIRVGAIVTENGFTVEHQRS